jgi:hypothetical protein
MWNIMQDAKAGLTIMLQLIQNQSIGIGITNSMRLDRRRRRSAC